MLTNAMLIKRCCSLLLLPSQLLLLLPLLLLLLASQSDGNSVTWGQVNKYASTLYAQDVYLTRVDSRVADADVAADVEASADVADVVYGSQNSSMSFGYTITAIHAYDMTPLEENNGDGGTVVLLSGGVGQQHCVLRFRRHKSVAHLPIVHIELVIYGVDL